MRQNERKCIPTSLYMTCHVVPPSVVFECSAEGSGEDGSAGREVDPAEFLRALGSAGMTRGVPMRDNTI